MNHVPHTPAPQQGPDPQRRSAGMPAGTGSAFSQNLKREASMPSVFDPLTGLPSRAVLEDMMQVCCKQQCALVVIGLDGFQHVNRAFGHEAGDHVLLEAASRIFDHADPHHFVSRVASDEFAALIPDGTLEEAEALADRLIFRMQDEFEVGANRFFVSASVGISVSDDAADPPGGGLLSNALQALGKAKEQGKGRSAVFSANPEEQRFECELLGGAWMRAIKDREFKLVYQPKIELQSGRITELEALLRWDHPELGWLSPNSFIPVAERLGLMVGVGHWVLDEACRQLAAWRTEGELDCGVAVNVSLQQLTASTFAEEVLQALRKHGLQPADLTLELTETDAMRETEISLEVLRALADAGVRISLDDFGVGQSSLAQFKHLPISELKIDRSFIAGIAHDAQSQAIVRAIVELAKSVGVGVVAEGVETVDQRTKLAELGCDEIQGYHVGRPVCAEDVVAKLAHYGRGARRVLPRWSLRKHRAP